MTKKAQAGTGLLGSESPSPVEQGVNPDQSSSKPIYPLQQVPLANITDRRYEIRKMVKNFHKIKALSDEKILMLEQLLRSNGEDTTGFLDDPAVWDEKQWHDTVRKTERIVRDVNEVLMTHRDMSPDAETKSEMLPLKPSYENLYFKDKNPGGGGGLQSITDY
jgi:hypothetical protein